MDFEDEVFTESDVLQGFKNYSEILDKESKNGESRLLNNELLIEQNVFTLKINNPVEEARYNDIKSDLLLYLRKHLKNKSVSVQLKIDKETRSKVIYTPQDKFDFLSKNNPALIELKTKLGLEFEY